MWNYTGFLGKGFILIMIRKGKGLILDPAGEDVALYGFSGKGTYFKKD